MGLKFGLISVPFLKGPMAYNWLKSLKNWLNRFCDNV